MVSLLIDTTGPQAFIGIAENGILVSKIIISEGRQLSKFLLPSIQSILQARTPNIPQRSQNLTLDTASASDLLQAEPVRKQAMFKNMADARSCKGENVGAVQNQLLRPLRYIAIGTGPGSFTGSRVGGIVAHSLSYGWNIPLISFSSTLLPDLDAIAAQSWEKYLSGERSAQIELVYISSTP
jgi:tRNA A37 threonylcarbamoyladenosine modification protein TsaB